MSHPHSSKATNLLSQLHGRVIQIRHTSQDIKHKQQRIYETMLRSSRHLNSGNFEAIHTSDLDRLYPLYDAEFFGGMIDTLVKDVHRTTLSFRLSPRMTSAAGKTVRTKTALRNGRALAFRIDFEIVISTFLLFQTFEDPTRPAIVCGLECKNRLEALMRIFEHEAIHLLEMLLWGDSNCSAPKFQSLALNIFGHQGVRHELITPRERAAVGFTLRVGDRVRFEHEGTEWRGIVNRITRRASVLVPDPRGQIYSDGHTYLKFYVPLESLVKDEGLDTEAHSSAD